MVTRIPPFGGVFRGTSVTKTQLDYIHAGVQRGMSSRAIQNALRGTPHAIRREALLVAMSEFRGVRDAGPLFRGVRGDLKPTPRQIQRVSQSFGRWRYKVTGRFTTLNPRTGARVPRVLVTFFDELPTGNEASARLRLAAEESISSMNEPQGPTLPQEEKGVVLVGVERTHIIESTLRRGRA